jgi:hypothetical protein
MFLIGLVLMPVVYFPLSYAWDHLYVYIAGTYTFTGDSASAITAIKLIISYMLALGVIFFLNWMIVNSKAQQYEG